MRIAIRTDAAMALGSGHVMRCLALADGLHARGARLTFLCAALAPSLEQLIRAHGHEVIRLPAGPALATEASWPLQAQGADAQACLQALGGSPAWDWLVVDHYGLGPPWETAMRAATHRLLAIDDLARAHDCDVLLDVNHFEHAQARYQGRLPAAAVVLTGPRYALLRPDFESHRRDVQPRSGPVRRLLILLGGMDADNVTGRAIEAIDCLPQARDIDVDVVIGAAHPARALLESLAASRPRLYLHVQSNEIAALCARADLAIGAGGGTTWERCCLGLPTLALCLAPNQREVLAAGAHAGFLYVPDGESIDAATLAVHLQALVDSSALRSLLSRMGMALVDGQGVSRVASLMWRQAVKVRPATASDSGALWAWRNVPRVRLASRDSSPISAESHHAWFTRALAAPDRILLVGERDGKPVGVVRFDLSAQACTEVSIYLMPEDHARGSGSALLAAAEAWLAREHPQAPSLVAHVMGDNTASHQLFERAGYARATTCYSKELPPWNPQTASA